MSGVPAALLSEMEGSACRTLCFTLLRRGRVLISTEGEAQHSAVVADVARAKAESQPPPATESELEADVSRLSCLKASALTELLRAFGISAERCRKCRYDGFQVRWSPGMGQH